MEHLTPAISPKILYWETNFGGKLSEQEFIHVAKAPAGPVSESGLEHHVFEIRTTDGSHRPVRVRLNDLARVTLFNINDKVAMRSHGITAFELQTKFLKENSRLTPNSLMAVYFYSAVAG